MTAPTSINTKNKKINGISNYQKANKRLLKAILMWKQVIFLTAKANINATKKQINDF